MKIYLILLNIIKYEKNKDNKVSYISKAIYDYLNEKGLEIYGNGWGDEPSDLENIMFFIENDEQKMFTSAKILYKLDCTGLSLSSNGWFDDDKEWNKYEKDLHEFGFNRKNFYKFNVKYIGKG